MWRAVWRIELHKSVLIYAAMLVIAVPYVLMRQSPMGCDDMAPFAFAVAVGMLLAGCIFRDAPGTAAFVFSLPMSRTRLFWYRWSLGVGMIALAAVACEAVLATGLREAAQSRLIGSVWYPMVRWLELGVLWPVASGALLGYQVMAFVGLRWRHRAPGGVRKGRALLVAMIVALAVVFVLGFLMWSGPNPGSGGSGGLETPARWGFITSPAFIAWLAVLTVMTTVGCLSCYRRLEIEA